MVGEAEDVDRDPCGFVTIPPSVVVKVEGTGRHDINGLLGIVVSFNVQHERYLVHMTKSQSTMALKKENLTKANLLDSYRAQTEQLRYDPRVREKMAKYLNLCSRFVAPFKLSHVIGGGLALAFGLVYSVGFLKTVMTVSVVALIATIAAPDVTSGPRAVINNFPERAKTLMEKQVPVLRGKMTHRHAVGIILLLIVFCLHSLSLTHPASASARPRRVISSSARKVDKSTLETYYNMGYEDAAKGRHHGSSLYGKLDAVKVELEEILEDVLADEDTFIMTKKQKSLVARMFRLPNLASIIYVYRSAIELGTDPMTDLFSMGQLCANIQHHTEWWRKFLLALSTYNVLRIFL